MHCTPTPPRRLRPRTAQMHTFDGDRFNKLTLRRHGDDHSFTPLLVMMFWIIIEKLWRSRPLIMTFGKTMPFGSTRDGQSSWKDKWDNVLYVQKYQT